jgi:WD40 repeat protein
MPDLKVRKQITAAGLVKEIPLETAFVHAARLAPDGRSILLCVQAAGIGCIDVFDVGEMTTRRVPIPSATDAISAIAFVPDGDRIVATCWSGHVFVLEWPSLREIKKHKVATTRLHGVAVMPDGRSAWVGGHDEKRTRIDLKIGRVIAQQGGESMWLSDAVISRDGETLITSDAATNVRLCDAFTGEQRAILRLGIAHNMKVTDGEVIVPNLYPAILDLATGEVSTKLEGEHELGARDMILVDDGKLAITVGFRDPLLTVWDRAEARPLLTHKLRAKGPSEAVFAVDAGAQLVVVPVLSEDPIQIWKSSVLLEAARGAAIP